MYLNYIDRLLRLLFISLLCVAGYFLVKYSVVYLYPFIIAVLCAFILNPAVSVLERKLKFPRFLSTLIILSVFLLVSGFTIAIIFNELIQGSTFLANQLPTHFNGFVVILEEFLNSTILPLYDKIATFFHSLNPAQQQAISSNLEKITNQITASGTVLIKGFLLSIPETLTILPSSLTILTVTLFATFMITKDWHELNSMIVNTIPFFRKSIVGKFLNHVKTSIMGFFKAQILIILVTALLIYTGLVILEIEYALTIALLAAFLDLLPYIGTGVIFIPWIFYVFVTGNYSMTIQLAVLYIVITVVRQIVEPKLLSASIGLNPLATLVTMFVGLNLWGLMGLFLSPFLLIIWNSCYQTGIFKRLFLFIKG
ncbi:sporulation integral membrane protein YtvI [Virgibacillus sp. DJP39]|uniref:sporulation integral membrane protein YtvI n=1 Tax=Virgibacillus sp. DJP39 TaxID=3409790 RepID=UPI003BB79EDF